MLRRTFLHLDGVGYVTERRLWEIGCSDWETALANIKDFSFGVCSRDEARRTLSESQSALAEGNFQYFAKRFKHRDLWRCFREFRHSTVYLDIETDSKDITMVGLYDGKDYYCLTKGENLGNTADVVSNYSQIVTYAGLDFDVPQMKKAFPNVLFDQIHIDLHPTLKAINVRGGLKKIELQAGILRPPHIANLRGWDAVKLWNRWEKLRDGKALETLADYNRADVVNLEGVMLWALPQLIDAAIAAPAQG